MTKFLSLIALAAALPAAAAELEPVTVPPSTPVPALAWTPQAAQVPDQRVIDLISRASEWRARKEDCRKALNEFYGNIVAREGHAQEWGDVLKKVWRLAGELENVQDALAQRMAARVAAEEKDPAERERRTAAVWTVRDFRRFMVYGNLIPRVIDEAHQDRRGLNDGRTYAGSSWSLAMTWEEGQAASRLLVSRTGYTSEEYGDVETAVRDEYKKSHPDSEMK